MTYGKCETLLLLDSDGKMYLEILEEPYVKNEEQNPRSGGTPKRSD